jgi:hypothetical protein
VANPSGRYDFQGLKKAGAAALSVALASSPSTAWILKGGKLTTLVLEFIANLLANNGLVIFNLGAIYIDGHLDQKQFDAVLSDSLDKLKLGKDKITPEQGKAIDDAVREAARRFINIQPRR